MFSEFRRLLCDLGDYVKVDRRLLLQKQNNIDTIRQLIESIACTSEGSEALHSMIIYCLEPGRKSQSAEFEDFPTKVKNSLSVGKKMVPYFFGKSGHYALSLENQRLTADWYVNTCLPRVFEKVCESVLAAKSSFIIIMTKMW